MPEKIFLRLIIKTTLYQQKMPFADLELEFFNSGNENEYSFMTENLFF